jgi:hypothetical protein
VTDLKALAYELLGEAQSILQHEAHLNPAAVVITPSENLIFDFEFETDDERDELYSEMMDSVYLDDEASSAVRLEGEGWGVLAESAQEAIVVTVSGSGFATWSLVSPYFRRNEQLVFQPPRETPDPGGEVALLGDWTGKTGAA